MCMYMFVNAHACAYMCLGIGVSIYMRMRAYVCIEHGGTTKNICVVCTVCILVVQVMGILADAIMDRTNGVNKSSNVISFSELITTYLFTGLSPNLLLHTRHVQVRSLYHSGSMACRVLGCTLESLITSDGC